MVLNHPNTSPTPTLDRNRPCGSVPEQFAAETHTISELYFETVVFINRFRYLMNLSYVFKQRNFQRPKETLHYMNINLSKPGL